MIDEISPSDFVLLNSPELLNLIVKQIDSAKSFGIFLLSFKKVKESLTSSDLVAVKTKFLVHHKTEGEEYTTLPKGQKHGMFRVFYGSRVIQEGLYEDGKETGLWKGWHYPIYQFSQPQLLWESFYENGKKGTLKRWYDSGILNSESFYVEGKKHVEKYYRPDGTLFSFATYQDGRKHGLYEQWNLEGTLTISNLYDRGVLINNNSI